MDSAAAHIKEQLKHISCALSEVEKTNADLAATKEIASRWQAEAASLAVALSRKEGDYAVAYTTCNELRANLDATERVYQSRLTAEAAMHNRAAADAADTLARREALIADLAAANRSLEAELAASRAETKAAERRAADLGHVVDAYRREQVRAATAEESAMAADARAAGLETSLAASRHETNVMRALAEERADEAGRLSAELLHTRSALVDVATRRHAPLPPPYPLAGLGPYATRSWAAMQRALYEPWTTTAPTTYPRTRSPFTSEVPVTTSYPRRRASVDVGVSTTSDATAAAPPPQLQNDSVASARSVSTGVQGNSSSTTSSAANGGRRASSVSATDRQIGSLTASQTASGAARYAATSTPSAGKQSGNAANATQRAATTMRVDKWREVMDDIERVSGNERRTQRWEQ